MTVKLDHLVIIAQDLDSGRRYVEPRFGLAPVGGGRHARMGTHNLLWSLGPVYLEVIAVDPGAARPDGPRWFGFDDPAVTARLAADGPFLGTWAIATDELPELAARAPVPHGVPEPFERDGMRWQVSLPEGPELARGGAWPLLIRWGSGGHPTDRLQDQELSLEALSIVGQGVDGVHAALGDIAAPCPVLFKPDEGPPRLSATFATPAGSVTL